MSIPSTTKPSAQRMVSLATQQKAARLSREMALYIRLLGRVPGLAPRLPPPPAAAGRKAFAEAARKDYAELLAFHGTARLPPSFVVKNVSALAPQVSATFGRFAQQHSGRLEVAVSSVGAQSYWQAQMIGAAEVRVLLVDSEGRELGRGMARGAAVSWCAG